MKKYYVVVNDGPPNSFRLVLLSFVCCSLLNLSLFKFQNFGYEEIAFWQKVTIYIDLQASRNSVTDIGENDERNDTSKC